jgi:hypothetical protein
LNEQDRKNIKAYASLILSVIEEYAPSGLPPVEIANELVDRGIITHILASVHAEELGELIGQYARLSGAKQSMEESGVDTSAIQVTIEAKLVEFMARNSDSIRRTQVLAPEVGINLDKLLEIVEKTGLKDRPATEIAQILGRVVIAQEKVMGAVFPEFIKQIRLDVMQLGMELLNPATAYQDRTGATLYFGNEASALQAEEHLRNLLNTTGVGQSIPVKMSQYGDVWCLEIGTPKQKATIPQKDWLPKGVDFQSMTRGH